MSYQSGSNLIVSYKAQTGLGSPASGASGIGLRFLRGSQGFVPSKAIIENEEVRRDGQTTRGRHGSRMVTGSFRVNLAVDDIDDLLAAAMRSTWTAAVTITEAAMTSITTTTSTIVAAGGSWITQGVRVGDLVKLADHSTAANNGIWLRVLGVTASTITVPANSLTANAVADTDFDLVVARTLVHGTAPVETYFTFDVYNADIDRSITYTDVKVNRLELSKQPNANIIATIGLIGLDWTSNLAAASPVLTSPTFSTSRPLVMADGKFTINSTDYTDVSGWNMSLDLGGSVPGVLAPNSPDAFLGNAKLNGSMTSLRTDLDWFDAFDAETQIRFMSHMIEVGDSDPKDFLSLYVGDAVFDGNDGPLGDEGAFTETIPWRAGKDEAGSGQAATMLKFSTSAS